MASLPTDRVDVAFAVGAVASRDVTPSKAAPARMVVVLVIAFSSTCALGVNAANDFGLHLALLLNRHSDDKLISGHKSECGHDEARLQNYSVSELAGGSNLLRSLSVPLMVSTTAR